MLTLDGVRAFIRSCAQLLGTTALACGTAAASVPDIKKSITVGGASIVIVPPASFTELTADSKQAYALCNALVSKSNTQLAAFVSEEELPHILLDQAPDMTRWCSVQKLRDKPTSLSPKEFAQLRRLYRDQQNALWKEAQARLPEAADKAEAAVQAVFGASPSISMPKMVALDVHLETDEQIASSIVSRVDLDDDTDYRDFGVVTSTVTYLFVRGHLLYLYVIGGAEDLQWTRETADKWARGILAANASISSASNPVLFPAANRTQEAPQSSTRPGRVRADGILDDLLVWAIVGAIVAVIVTLVAKWRSRNTRTESPPR